MSLAVFIRRHGSAFAAVRLLSCIVGAGLAGAFASTPGVARTVPPAGSWQTLTNARLADESFFARSIVNLFKLDRSQLGSRTAFIYWVAMNDCRAALKHNNEFEWEDVRRWYEARTDAILDGIAPLMHASLWVELGAYDMAAGAFPIAYQAPPEQIKGVLLTEGQETWLCGGGIPHFKVPAMNVEFDRSFPALFPIDRAAAKAYVDARSNPTDRSARVQVLFGLGPPVKKATIDVSGRPVERLVFPGRIEFVQVAASFATPGRPVQTRVIGELIAPSSPAIRAAMPPANRVDSLPLLIAR
ncbi:hypothetical protein ABLE93_25640 [Xanthobacter sp. KR7-65]|uniref:hypothetical protein n=1 Tax=Xanthobacter sp. KR7-65 TaxID=3156612 RepID=UPI0032B45A18